jgi:hypothetical protein
MEIQIYVVIYLKISVGWNVRAISTIEVAPNDPVGNLFAGAADSS